ncbi:MAG: NUDIX domain-containing protein [Candidatus Nomurabacteria bacterium]|nr:NUDIX domain-containing protein [Candidatus Nomurabacteria bacterium]
MDLSIPIQDTTLYIRVAGFIKTKNGLLFEQSKDGGYIFTIGGKIKLNENSEEAIKREVMEEIGLKVDDIKLCSIMENLYSKSNKKTHEICFVYIVNNIFEGDIPKGFIEVKLDDINNFDVRPSSMVKILNDKDTLFKHIIQN